MSAWATVISECQDLEALRSEVLRLAGRVDELLLANNTEVGKRRELEQQIIQKDIILGQVLKQCVATDEENRRLFDALDDMVNQFAGHAIVAGRLCRTTDGLSALEHAFEALGRQAPHPCPEHECQHDGCHKFATCGTPTADGYKRLCGQHYREIVAKQ